MNEYVLVLEELLNGIEIFVDYDFHYTIDDDAGTLKIWIEANFQGGGRFNGFEFLEIVSNYLIKSKYRYNFLIANQNIRWDNAPHHKNVKAFPHHLHINSKVVESIKPELEFILEFIKKYL